MIDAKGMGRVKTRQNGSCRDVPAALAQVLDPACEVQLDSDMISGDDAGVPAERKVGRDTHSQRSKEINLLELHLSVGHREAAVTPTEILAQTGWPSVIPNPTCH